MRLTVKRSDSNLLFSLDGQPPLSVPLSAGLEACCAAYAALRQSAGVAALLALGQQLADALFSSTPPQLLRQWLTAPTRQLEVADDELLLCLPWEILAADGQFLAADPRPFEVIRRTGAPAPVLRQPQYSDLALVFMAADPELSSGLSYEAEERAIFAATRSCRNLNLIVDESGSLEGLRSRLFDTGHCDVLHLSCHGSFDPERGFLLHLEDRQFGLQPAAAHDFISLRSQCGALFLSACHSAESRGRRSFLVELADLGFANLVGWDGAVADEDATRFASHFYQALQFGETVPAACALARQAMLREGCICWHSARCCLGPEGGLALVSRRQPKSPRRGGRPCHELLDSKKGEVQVASRETFVGRRWQTKEALRAFAERRPVLLYGIGGTGKSSLAARIVDRLEPNRKAAVLYRHYQTVDLLEVLQDAARGTEIDFAALLAKAQSSPGSLKGILLYLLEGVFHEQPIVLVADDLEQHILEPLSASRDKAEVKPEYQAVFTALIEAFAEADTDSRLLFTSRCRFSLRDRHGEDLTQGLKAVNVPDMTPAEQEKHWLALAQRDGGRKRDREQDASYLKRIFAAAQGNPGLQAVLFQPLLRGELAALDRALERIAASQVKPPADEVDKYFQRIALEVYSQALSSSERETLRLLTLFEVPVPEALLLQAGPKAGIADPAAALRRLDNFGLLCHWQGRDVDGHISCYGLARKMVKPLGLEDRNFLAKICAPQLWRIWFKDFLEENAVPETETLKESIDFIRANHFPDDYAGELPLSSETDQRRIAVLHRLCIRNSLAVREQLGFKADFFISLLELSILLNVFEKLTVSSGALDGFFATQQIKEWHETFIKIITNIIHWKSSDIRYIALGIIFQQFSWNSELLIQAYLIYFGDLDISKEKLLHQADLTDENNRLSVAFQLARTDKERAYICYRQASFLCQNGDYVAAEKMYELSRKFNPNDLIYIVHYASFFEYQKHDCEMAEEIYKFALNATPELQSFYISFLIRQQRYDEATEQYESMIAVSPEDANEIGNYAKMLFVQGNRTKAIEMLERAERHQENWGADLHVELAFYRYAHCQPQPISPLKQLLLDGVRSLGWNLADNVRRAEQDGHPNPALLTALAKVISDDQPIETLAQFEEWSNAND